MKKNQIYILIIVGLVAFLGYQIWTISAEDTVNSKTVSTDGISEVVMYKNPGCQCCDGWAAHMEQAGFAVRIQPTDRLAAIKSEQGIPYNMGSCHTALVGNYVVEGHVPAEDVKRLLEKKPDAVGIGVPGMPAGSPGMESPNPEPYEVYLIEDDGSQSVYARH